MLNLPPKLLQQAERLAQLKQCPLEEYLLKIMIQGIKHEIAYNGGSFNCIECEKLTYEDFMVRNKVWREAVSPKGGRIHLACLEKRLGRELCPDDFQDLPVNAPLRLGVRMGNL